MERAGHKKKMQTAEIYSSQGIAGAYTGINKDVGARSMMEPVQIVDLLRRYAYPAASEALMCEAVAQVLRVHGVPFEREKYLSPLALDRIEFYLPHQGLGIECKISGSPHAVLRQLLRYARSEIIQELVLLTSRMKHRRMPATVNGKPLHLVYGGRL